MTAKRVGELTLRTMADSATEEPQWPPRSPYEALLGTPSGRDKLRKLAAEQASLSPSPIRRSKSLHALGSKSGNMPRTADVQLDDEDDDEETLQLKLQEIQARLRLKRLQNAKTKKAAGSSDAENDVPRSDSVPLLGPELEARKRPLSSIESRRIAASRRDLPTPAVEVPVSPLRKREPSPRKPQVGLSSGHMLSTGLTRTSSLRSGQAKTAGTAQEQQQQQQGGHLRRGRTPVVGVEGQQAAPRPKSFNERLAEARSAEEEQAQRQQRIRQLRTKNFDVGREEMEEYRNKAVDLPQETYRAPEFSREDILGATALGCGLKRSNTVPAIRTAAPAQDSSDGFTGDSVMSDHSAPQLSDTAQLQTAGSQAPAPHSSSGSSSRHLLSAGASTLSSSSSSNSTSASFDSYSCWHLSRRVLPHSVLTRTLAGKKLLKITDVLRDVKAPDFALPDVEQDIVVFGIVASKTDPRSHQQKGKSLPTKDESSEKETSTGAEEPPSQRGKYMAITLTDLKWELDLFLFDGGFDRYWKLSLGSVIAILNPGIMPPPPGKIATGRFSLVVNSDDDSILEIGTARDLGFCGALRRDGNVCGSWTDKRKTDFCEFHTSEAVRKKRSARMEVATMDFGRDAGGGRRGGTGRKDGSGWDDWLGGRTGPSRFRRGDSSGSTFSRLQNGVSYDRETHSHAFVSRSLGAAALLDSEDRAERAEALRRRIREREKETEMAKKLAESGAGAGRVYARAVGAAAAASATRGGGAAVLMGEDGLGDSTDGSRGSQEQKDAPQLDAKSLGLLRRPATATSLLREKDRLTGLANAKRKRPGSAQSSSTVDSGPPVAGAAAARRNAPVGWGSALASRLARMKDDVLREQGQTTLDASSFAPGTGATVAGAVTGTARKPAASDPAATATSTSAADRDHRPPVRKKTRFVTAKGIREAGRESLGDELTTKKEVRIVDGDGDGDGDELVIV